MIGPVPGITGFYSNFIIMTIDGRRGFINSAETGDSRRHNNIRYRPINLYKLEHYVFKYNILTDSHIINPKNCEIYEQVNTI